MKGSHKLANLNWAVGSSAGDARDWTDIKVALLMDIRTELQALNTLLGCSNFLAIPGILRQIAENTRPRRKYTRRQT